MIRVRSVTSETSVFSQQEGTVTPPVSYAGQSWFDSRCCDHAGAARVAEHLFRNQDLESSTLSTGSIAGDPFVIGSACCAGRGSFSDLEVAGSTPAAWCEHQA